MTRIRWTAKQEALLIANYPTTPTAELARALGLRVDQVHRKACKLGLKKTPEFSAQHGHRLDGKIGKESRFQAGHTPWNAGKSFKAGGRSVEHQFKPGMLPHNHKPIGHIRTTADGYLEQKMTDTGVTRRDYVLIHRLVWMAAHGPIPAGHVVVFRDGNKLNPELTNLELITRQELARRNSIHRLPPELKQTIRAITSIKRRIKKHEKQG